MASVLWKVMEAIKPGVSELALDSLAEKLIRKEGAEPGFKKVPGYRHTICVSTNDVVVHGIPTKYVFAKGDIVGIDCGVYYKGFHTDMAETIEVRSKQSLRSSELAKSEVRSEIVGFLETGKRALKEAIAVAKPGNRIGHISKIIQDIVEKEGGYSIVRSLVGHGVGRDLHEEPEVPGFLQRDIKKTPKLNPGMVIAVEVIYNMGNKEIVIDDDGWTIRAKDAKLSGLFERTIAISEGDAVVLTA